MSDNTSHDEDRNAGTKTAKDHGSADSLAGMYTNSRILFRSRRQSAKLANCDLDACRKGEGKADFWEKREQKIINRIQEAIIWYRYHANINRAFHFTSSAIILTGGVIAPVLITYGDGGFYGNTLSIIITILMGLSEGARRLFNFHDKWRSFYISHKELVRIREAYRDLTAGMVYGSCEWINVYLELRDDYFDLTMSETNNFFSGLSGGQDKPDKGAGS